MIQAAVLRSPDSDGIIHMRHHTHIIVSEIIGFVNGKFGLRGKNSVFLDAGERSGPRQQRKKLFQGLHAVHSSIFVSDFSGIASHIFPKSIVLKNRAFVNEKPDRKRRKTAGFDRFLILRFRCASRRMTTQGAQILPIREAMTATGPGNGQSRKRRRRFRLCVYSVFCLWFRFGSAQSFASGYSPQRRR